MKFSPLILLALVSAASAAPTRRDGTGKCRAKSKGVSASGSATPTGSAVPAPSALGTPIEASAAPTANAASSSAPASSAPASSESASSSTESASASASAAPTGNALIKAPSGNYNPPKVANQTVFSDPSITPSLPTPLGPDPQVSGIISPPGSVGLNPPGDIPADDPLAKTMLERINQWRSVYQAEPLFWNSTISGFAVGYAKECQGRHFMNHGEFGEVAVFGGDITNADMDYMVKRWVDAWFVEGRFWDFEKQEGMSGKDVGHWQILTDAMTNQVGCGWSGCGKIYCDISKNYTKIFSEHVPDYKEHVWPQVEIPWDEYRNAF
ncbi:uncharacterized protein LOC62_01G001682 [Vanrija pseudolonga]|uniref:SCP domain-containing protein n=1 Tax=Vanrija pseudolonga TaxID=143232 RepID=A0AAF0Y4W5_9TREE|nr:hypothetical protein LOC62_01G001682 [Vanrija pseudolonga]